MAVAELCSTESEQDGFHGNGKSQPAGLFNDLSLDTPSFRSANTHFSDDLRVRPQSSDDPVLTSEVPHTQDFPWMLHARQLSRE